MTQHTKGPWRVEKMDNGYGFQILNEKGNRVMGSIASNGAGIMGQSAQAKANANLIAAAPELLLSAKLEDMFPIVTEQEKRQCENFARSLGWQEDIPLEHFASTYRKAAISAATGRS